MNTIRVIQRAIMPEINHVTIDGLKHHLGVLKDFHWCEEFGEFLPEGAAVSMSWVHLGADEVLTPHVHPIASMIVICEGRVTSLGELEQVLTAGDALLVPAGRLHGFRGLGPDGFWGLSVQFEPQSLYRDPGMPRVEFARSGPQSEPPARQLADPAAPVRSVPPQSDRWEGGALLSTLLERNQSYLTAFADNLLFRMARSERGCFAEHTKMSCSVFLDYFKVWSNAFQRMLLSRAAFCDNPRFMALANDHLLEEFGHNAALSQQRGRGGASDSWDPILEACCEWFVQKMLTLDNPERTVLVHLVVEASANVFYAHFGPLMQRAGEGAAHFNLHAHGVDHAHVDIGIELLRDLSPRYLEQLCDIQARGWDMLNSMFHRIGELVASAMTQVLRSADSRSCRGPEAAPAMYTHP